MTHDADSEHALARAAQPAAVALGAEIRRLRRRRELSQRSLTRMIGLSAHSNLADYEAGRRLPPADIVRQCERVLEVSDGHLSRLHEQAVIARADLADQQDIPAGDEPGAGAPGRTGRLRSRLLGPAGLAIGCVLAAGVIVLVVLLTSNGNPKLAAHQSRRTALSPNGATLADHLDPQRAGCDSDAVDLGSAPLRLTGQLTVHGQRLLPGAVVANITLRYSAACHAAWARLTPLPVVDFPVLGTADVATLRPADGARTNFYMRHLEEGYGNILLTTRGCVRAEGRIRFTAGVTVSARTACLPGRLS